VAKVVKMQILYTGALAGALALLIGSQSAGATPRHTIGHIRFAATPRVAPPGNLDNLTSNSGH